MDQKRFVATSANTMPQDHAFNCIDLVKFICAFLICIIHIRPFNTPCPELVLLKFYLQNCFCRIAVPFYFVVSGFFLFRKTEFYDLRGDRIKTYVFKIIRLLGIWSILLFRGSQGHLWYLGALVVATILLWFLLKKNVRLGYIIALALAAFVIGLFGDTYYGFTVPLLNYTIPKLLLVGIDNVIHTTRNGFSFGLLFVLMGALFAQKRVVVNRIAAVVGFLLSFAAMFFEVYWLSNYSDPKDYNLLICLLPTTFFLFYLVSHVNLKNRPIYGSLRIVGLLVFLSHQFVNYFVGLAITFLKDHAAVDLTAFQFTATVFLTLILAIVIERLSKTEKFCWLKYLFS